MTLISGSNVCAGVEIKLYKLRFGRMAVLSVLLTVIRFSVAQPVDAVRMRQNWLLAGSSQGQEDDPRMVIILLLRF
jgi:hypothetical protein